MMKVSHLKPSGNYMYHNLQHYESLHFATQSICVFIIVWKSIHIIPLNSTDWLVCIRSTHKMFSEVSCVIQKHVCPHIKYIYINIYTWQRPREQDTGQTHSAYEDDAWCARTRTLGLNTKTARLSVAEWLWLRRSFQRVNWWLKLNLLWPSQVHQSSENYKVLMVH